AAARTWEAGAEFDFIGKDGEGFVVSEVKFKKLTASEKAGLKKQLAEKWKSSTASHKNPGATFEILDTSALKG
ncbi:MAG: hypothetical protein ACKOEZ_10885, partial [Spartobacteria bacterium]